MYSALVSIIVPVYKVEKYLSKCVVSISCQRYKNLEIILVDDGSMDCCPQICDEYALKDSRILVIHKYNGGLSDARNVGLDVASGDYIMFVDSDDYIASTMVEKLYDSLRENNADMSICNFQYVDENGVSDFSIPAFSNDALPICNGVVRGIEVMREKLFAPKPWYWVVAWNKLYRREIFRELRYPAGKIQEDEFVIHDILFQTDKIACCSEMLYFYVQRRDSIMGSIANNIRKIDYVEALFLRAKAYVQHEDTKSLVEKTIQNAIIHYRKMMLDGVVIPNQIMSQIQTLFREVYCLSKKNDICFRWRNQRDFTESFISLRFGFKMTMLRAKIGVILGRNDL